MLNKDLNDSQKPTDDKARDRPESRPGWKSKWVESTAPAADDPISPEEMQGHNLLGNANLRVERLPASATRYVTAMALLESVRTTLSTTGLE